MDENRVSIYSTLNTELLALIEYARLTKTVNSIDFKEMMSALQSIVQYEIEARLGSDPKKETLYKIALERNGSDVVWRDVASSIANALTDTGTDFDDGRNRVNIYKRNGSVYQAVIGNKRVDTNVSGTVYEKSGSISADIVYFIPTQSIAALMAKLKCNQSQAINMLGTDKNVRELCNYPRQQQRTDGSSYIFGAKLGLIKLASRNGILARIGVTGDFVPNPKASGQYAIRLDKKNTELFNSALSDSTSPLYDNITVTARANDGEQSTSFSGGSEDPDDDTFKKNKAEADLVAGYENLGENIDNSDIQRHENEMSQTIKRVINAINAYQQYSGNRELPPIEIDVHGDDIERINSISKAIVKFGNAIGVQVPCQSGTIGVQNLRPIYVADVDSMVRANMYASMKKYDAVSYIPDIQRRVRMLIDSLMAFSFSIKQNIADVYTTASFKGSTKHSMPVDEPKQVSDNGVKDTVTPEKPEPTKNDLSSDDDELLFADSNAMF